MTDERHEHVGDEAPAQDAADERLLAALLAEFDEAAARGEAAALPDDARLSAETRRELAQLASRVALLHDAARAGALVLTEVEDDTARGAVPTADAGREQSLIGEQIGRFEILAELGRGGYGVVFLARDVALGREVALKLPRPEALVTPELRQRFRREAEAAGRLDHPHVLPIYEVGEDGGLCYLVTPFCHGPTLADWLNRQTRPVGVAAAAQVVAHLADGVEHAHRFGVLHRDIKPGNVLLEPARESIAGPMDERPLSAYVPKLADFGLAKLLGDVEQATRSGTLLGTPAYMAPEQADGRLDAIGPTTDVYALGVLLYELLTGKPPLVGATDAETQLAVTSREPAMLRRVRADVPRDLEAVAHKCLAKANAERYASAGELAADLRRFLAGEPTRVRPIGPVGRLVRTVRRRRAASAAVAAIAVLATALAAGGTWYANRLAEEEAWRRQQQYAHDMRAAFAARNLGHPKQAEELLARYADGTPGADERGLEWYWLDRALNPRAVRFDSGHGETYTAAFSADGQVLLTGGADGVIRAWDPADGKPLYELRGHTSCVNQIKLAPDGKRLGSASCDQTVRLWNLEERREIGVVGRHAREVHALAFARQRPWLASGGHDGYARVWNLETGDAAGQVQMGRDSTSIDAVAFNEDDTVLVVAHGSGLLLAWSTTDWSQRGAIDRNVLTLALRGEHLLCGARDGRVTEVSLAGGGERLLHHLPSEVHALAVCPSGERVYVAGVGGAVHVVGLNDQRRQVLSHPAKTIQALALSPDGRSLASVNWNGMVMLWNLHPGGELIPHVKTEFSGRVATRIGRRWIVDSYGSGLYVRNRETLEMLGQSPSFGLPRGISPDEQLGLMETGSHEYPHLLLIQLPGLGNYLDFSKLGRVRRVALSQDRRRFAALSDDRFVIVAAFESDAEGMRLPLPEHLDPISTEVALNEDGSLLVLMAAGSHLTAYDTRSGRPTSIPDDLSFVGPSTFGSGGTNFSPDGEWLAAHWDQEWTVLRVRSGEEARRLRHSAGLTGNLAWSPDGRRLAVCTARHSVVVFDARTGEELGELDDLGDGAPLLFSADGRSLWTTVQFEGEVYWRAFGSEGPR